MNLQAQTFLAILFIKLCPAQNMSKTGVNVSFALGYLKTFGYISGDLAHSELER